MYHFENIGIFIKKVGNVHTPPLLQHVSWVGNFACVSNLDAL